MAFHFVFHRTLHERKTALEKMMFPDAEQQDKWQQVIKVDYMSSKESATDAEDEVIIVKPLPWRSVHMDQLFWRLDDKTLGEKSPQA